MAQVATLHRRTTRRFERQPERLETALATGTALGQGCGHGSEDGEATRTVPGWGRVAAVAQDTPELLRRWLWLD
jgi:hypothetical protein